MVSTMDFQSIVWLVHFRGEYAKLNPLRFTMSARMLPSSTMAQKYEFQSLICDDGLSAEHHISIEQDYQDFMWFGTFNGLNRFDGYSCKVYKNDPQDPGSLGFDSRR